MRPNHYKSITNTMQTPNIGGNYGRLKLCAAVIAVPFGLLSVVAIIYWVTIGVGILSMYVFNTEYDFNTGKM